MDEAHLVGVHEAGVAHHVAAVGQVDGQDRPAAVLYSGAGALYNGRKKRLALPFRACDSRHSQFNGLGVIRLGGFRQNRY
jgi:hypothetical protein